MTSSAPIIFLILFTGGTIAILEKTGAINGLISNVISTFRTKQSLFIAIVGSLFSILGTTGIVVNSVIGFIPIGLIVARSLKWDAVAGAAVIYIGRYAGFNATILSTSPLVITKHRGAAAVFRYRPADCRLHLFSVIIYFIYLSVYEKTQKSKGRQSAGERLVSGGRFTPAGF